jgi:hypothetical protein
MPEAFARWLRPTAGADRALHHLLMRINREEA